MIEQDDVIVRTTAREGWAAAEGASAVVVIASQLTPELIAEGLVRDVVHAVQSQRKSLDLEFTDRIELMFESVSVELRSAIQKHIDYIASETLALSAVCAESVTLIAEASVTPSGGERSSTQLLDIGGYPLSITIRSLARSESSMHSKASSAGGVM